MELILDRLTIRITLLYTGTKGNFGAFFYALTTNGGNQRQVALSYSTAMSDYYLRKKQCLSYWVTVGKTSLKFEINRIPGMKHNTCLLPTLKLQTEK